MNLKDKILEKGYSYNIYRITRDLRAYNKSRILRVLIREFSGSLIL